MTNSRNMSLVLGLATLTTLGLASVQPVHAQINGFSIGTGANQFTTNTNGISNTQVGLSGSTLQMTDSQNGEASSAWYNTKQSINKFTASFTYRDVTGSNSLTPGQGSQADGFTFALQNVGLNALGDAGGSLAYAGGNLLTNPSVAVETEMYAQSTTGVGTNGYTNTANPFYGDPGKYNHITDPVDFYNGNPVNVNLVYNGTTLYEALTDTVTGNTQAYSYTLNIPSTLGANTAYVGLTASTGGATATQQFSNFSFVNSTLPAGYSSITSAADGTTAVVINGSGTTTQTNPPTNEGVANVFDGDPGTKYLNFTGAGSGFTVKPTAGSSVVKGLSLTSANDTPGRDPAHFMLYGSNDNGTTFTFITGQTVQAFTNRYQTQNVLFSNSTAYTTYKVLFDTLADPTNSIMQIGDVNFLVAAAPEPGEMAGMLLGGLGVLGLIARKRRANA